MDTYKTRKAIILHHSSTPMLEQYGQQLSTPEDPYRVNCFESALYATVLEDVIRDLRIMAQCNNALQVALAQVDINKLRALKYQIEQPAEPDELAGIDPRALECEEYKLRKLFADRNLFREVIESTYASLCTEKSYAVMADHNTSVVKKKAQLEILLEVEMSNRLQRRELNRQCRQQRNHIKSAIYDAACNIAQLKKNVEDAALNAMIRSRYVTNWQGSRTEQNYQQIRDKEVVKENNIEQYKQRFDQEQRIHAEIEMLATIQTNETLHKVESWMNKYDVDMEAADLKIQIMKNNFIVQEEQRVKLEETIEEHDKLMKGWLKFKEDRENARLYREKMNNAAIVVQAWWRGLLVRNQLGPYKPVPKKKGGKKKN